MPVEGTWRAHQVPLVGGAGQAPSTSRSSTSGCGRTGPTSCSTRTAARAPRSSTGCRRGDRRMSANPHANGGLLLHDLRLPDVRRPRGRVACAGRGRRGGDAGARRVPARRVPAERRAPQLPAVRPGRDCVEPARRGVRGDDKTWEAETLPTDVCARNRRPGDGDPLRDTRAKAGSRATCSPAVTACSRATRRSPTSSTRCSTSTRSG